MDRNKKLHKAKPRKAHKAGRNFRWGGITHSTTKYRARHRISPDAKRRKKEG